MIALYAIPAALVVMAYVTIHRAPLGWQDSAGWHAGTPLHSQSDEEEARIDDAIMLGSVPPIGLIEGNIGSHADRIRTDVGMK